MTEEPRTKKQWLMAAEGNPTQEDLISEAKEKRDALKAELIRVKQKLSDLDSDIEALQQQQQMEIEAITNQWKGGKRRPAGSSERHQGRTTRQRSRQLKDKQKIKQRTFKAEIKGLEKADPPGGIRPSSCSATGASWS